MYSMHVKRVGLYNGFVEECSNYESQHCLHALNYITAVSTYQMAIG
jgi:hypothetical protein